MSSNQSQSPDKSKRFLSPFTAENVFESDIEQIWRNFMKTEKNGHRKTPGILKEKMTSTETTPSTDYGGKYFLLHPETEEEALEHEKRIARMNSVLKAKKMHPKSNLPQVILYDNVSHERLLAKRVEEIRRAHEAVEKQAKRREESFVKSLERRQQEWMKRDERIISKFESENTSEFKFTFGELYSKADYPYQTVVQASHNVEPLSKKLDHARRRPVQLPQITNRPIYDDELDQEKTFITKLSKDKNINRFLDEVEKENVHDPYRNRRRRKKKHRNQLKQTNWIKDKRFHTLTSHLGDRYSPTNKNHSNAAGSGVVLSKIV